MVRSARSLRLGVWSILAVWGGLPLPAQEPAAPAALNLQQETEALMESAYEQFQEGLYQEALGKVQQVKAKLTRPFAQILFIEGACLFNLGQHGPAIEVLKAFLDGFPTDDNAPAVKLALGRAQLADGKAEEGIETLKELAAESPALMGQAGLYIADHLRGNNRAEEALPVLKKVLEADLRSPEGIQAAMMSADILVEQGEVDEASRLMESVRSISSGGGNIAQLNNVSLKLGDQMMERKSFPEALAAYRMVRRQSEISRIQAEKITSLEQSIANRGRGPIQGTEEELANQLESEKALLAEIEGRPDYDASLFYRMGRCYFEMGRFWESLLAFDVILEEFEGFPQRDRALFGMIIANGQLQRVPEARKLCERYIADFPDGPQLGQVSELYGMLAYNIGDMEGAQQSFEKALGFPKADKERLLFLRATVLFEMQRFEDARVCLEMLLAENAESAYADDAQYRIALSYFYQNDFKSVMDALRDYLRDYPRGQYGIDAKYRLAFIKFQGREVDEAMADLLALIEEAPNDPNIGQVYALLGDGYNQKQDFPKALEAFAMAVEKAKSADVLAYAMENATDLYAGQNQWAELAEMWEGYYETHQEDEAQALKAIFWISRAKVKEDKKEEAMALMADAIRPKMGNPANEQVEVLIQQLASLAAPRRRRLPEGGFEGPTFEEVGAEVEAMLQPPQEAMNGTAQMRLLFAKAWLAKQMREPEKAEKLFSIIVEVASADDLSPLLLSVVGDTARRNGDLAKAGACYERLQEFFPDSEFADAAPVGLAEIAFADGRHEEALELFEKAAELYAASSRLLDATLGQAKSLVELNRLEAAEELYLQISNTREWRGEATAISLYMLGEIEFRRDDPARAIPYYQRVFIAHQRWKPWVAKSYLQCARAFLALNRPAAPPERENSDREAAKVYLIEMLAREDLQEQEEFQQAKEELAQL